LDSGFIYAIEEPENHLHPLLQREALHYFLSLAKETQVLICTHSAVFASKPEITAVYMVSKDEEGATQIEPINDKNIDRIIKELGIRAGDILDYDVISFVEGADDVKIFTALATSFGKDIESRVGFIDSEGWNSMAYYANARVLKSRIINVQVFAIFDGDIDKEEKYKKIKERLTTTLKLKEGHVVTLEKHSIEAYLLVPSAIVRAFPNIRLSEEEISHIISQCSEKKNKKEVLKLVLRRGGIDFYDGEMGAKIMQAMTRSEIDEELKSIINVLSGRSSKNQK
jgi:putative ATP-dependent endonuclease of OLD family